MTLDTSDPSIKAAYLRIRHHENNENWFVLGYGDSRNKLTVLGSGAGGIDGARDLLGKENVTYGYIQARAGEEVYVLVVNVSDSAPSLKKAKASSHKHTISEILPFMHAMVYISAPEQLTEAAVEEAIKGTDMSAPVQDIPELGGGAPAPKKASRNASPVLAAAAEVKEVPAAVASSEPAASPVVPAEAVVSPTTEAEPVASPVVAAPAAVEVVEAAPAVVAAPEVKEAEKPRSVTPPPARAVPRTGDPELDALAANMSPEELAQLAEDLGIELNIADTTTEVIKGTAPAAVKGNDAVISYEAPTEESKEEFKQELLRVIEFVEQDSMACRQVNFNNNEFFDEQLQVRLGKALARNTMVVELFLANCNLKEAGAIAIAEGLKANKSINNVNVESNYIGPNGLEAMAAMIAVNDVIQEMRLTNQRVSSSQRAEKQLVKALEDNKMIQKFGMTFKDTSTRNLADKFIFRNKDLARQRRLNKK